MAGTNNSWNNQIAGSYNQIILNAGTNGVAISTDASAATVNVATGGAVKTSTFGSTNSTSATTVQSGSGALNVTSTNGALTINSGTGALSISNDASATTLTIGTGGAVKTVTLGSTNTTSVTNIACGTGGANFGTSANAHATVVGSTTAASTTTIQAPSAGVILTGVQGVAVANKNYVTINTATGAIGSDAGASSSISITGDTGGALTGSSFTFTGGTTGLSFGGAGTTETLTFAGITANGGTVSLATDATTSTINVGTGAGIKTSTFGSTNSTSATTVQSGSGALNIISTNGAQTHNSGTGALGISTDASATTVSFATGAAVKTVTLGSTNTTSSTAIKSGSGNVAINSGLTIDSTGRNYNTVQPAFLAYLSTTQNNVTGDGTYYTVINDTEAFDQGNNYNNATGTFTAPITGKYFFTFTAAILVGGAPTSGVVRIVTTARTYFGNLLNPTAAKNGGSTVILTVSTLADMTATDTAIFQAQADASTKTTGVSQTATANNVFTYVSGYLVC